MIVKFDLFKLLDGKTTDKINLAHELAGVIADGKGEKNVLQKLDLSMRLMKLKPGDEIELSPIDVEIVEEFCNNASLKVIAAGQILDFIKHPVKEDEPQPTNDNNDNK